MKLLDNYFKSCEEVKKTFIKKYFKETPTGCYWIADRIGEVLMLNDYFFDMQIMVDALLFNVSEKKFFEWYEYQLKESMENRSPINLVNWIKLKK